MSRGRGESGESRVMRLERIAHFGHAAKLGEHESRHRVIVVVLGKVEAQALVEVVDVKAAINLGVRVVERYEFWLFLIIGFVLIVDLTDDFL